MRGVAPSDISDGRDNQDYPYPEACPFKAKAQHESAAEHISSAQPVPPARSTRQARNFDSNTRWVPTLLLGSAPDARLSPISRGRAKRDVDTTSGKEMLDKRCETPSLCVAEFKLNSKPSCLQYQLQINTGLFRPHHSIGRAVKPQHWFRRRRADERSQTRDSYQHGSWHLLPGPASPDGYKKKQQPGRQQKPFCQDKGPNLQPIQLFSGQEASEDPRAT
ncbi:hypothetical protein BBAD15_g7202 [Beauveria bassiana D1-5]|uniref:Uncharacterized protein n=1 Tax=Beauveria bassiana D1-5 TaxID=1245745 RepID=A0A0A2W3D1_BEABA|nr:hypothetical protein BBAD15_g7202 [Beauveria bassiana D1-5]